MWWHLGWYSGLVFAGSVSGAVAWSANIPANSLYYAARDPAKLTVPTAQRDNLRLLATLSSWVAAFNVTYGFEAMCLTLAKVMVLGRLIQHARMALPRDHKRQRGDPRANYVRAFNCVAAAVALCGLVGMAASVAGAYYKAESGKLAALAADACSSSGAYTAAARALAINSSSVNKRSDQVISVQNTSEMVAMLLIVATYLVVVPTCIVALQRTGIYLNSTHRRMAAASAPARLMQAANPSAAISHAAESSARAQLVVDLTMQAAVAQQKRLVAVCVMVFLTFQPRAIFDIIQAIGNQDTVANLSKCGVCDTCQSVYLLVNLWLRYTPEFRAIAVALSSPLPLSVSLWFMMSEHERDLLRTGDLPSSSRVEMAAAFAQERMHIDLPLEAPEAPAPGPLETTSKSSSEWSASASSSNASQAHSG